jgi:predicted transcriptional regulator
MSKTEMRVYEEICNNNYATAKQIAKKIGKSEKTVYRAIKRLKEMQKIERNGDDYNGSWIVKG